MIQNLFSNDEVVPEKPPEPARAYAPNNSVLSLFDSADQVNDESGREDFVISEAPAASMAETVRQSGLAWSAGIAFFAAVVFMLILGWGADVLLGTTPWGIVGGIMLGSVIGFIQFFRLTSQIFKK